MKRFGYLQQRDARTQMLLDVMQRTMKQYMLDTLLITMHEDFGWGYDRLSRLAEKWGETYDDADFFARCGQIGKQVGFSWGGDWRSFPDRPHFQWDANGRYSSSMILAGKYPPQMEEYDYMDQDKFDAMMDTYLAKRAKLPVDEWATEVWAAAYEAGVVNGTAPKGLVTRQEVIAMIARSK